VYYVDFSGTWFPENYNGIQEVSGSIPLISTKSEKSGLKEKF